MGNLKAHLALLTVNVIYALSYAYSKHVLADFIPPFAFILIRVLGATMLFWLLISVSKLEKIDRKDWVTLFLCGLFGVAANQLMFFEGLANTFSINASVIMVATPLIVLILSRLFLGEKMVLQKVIGVGIGMTGAVLLIVSRMGAIGGFSGYGDLMILLNASSYGVYLVIVKPLMKKYNPITVIRWAFTFGLIMVLPFGLSQWSQINWEMGFPQYWRITFIVLATTFLTYLLTVYSLGKVSPTLVSAYIYIQPILATLIAVINKEEELEPFVVVYGMMIFLGVFLVSIPINKTIGNQNLRKGAV
ncbi:MAG: DMT family transporter [Flavobacteriales bacterium]|nr:DMT family transporter [Flavobacteriales bacterium]